MAGIKIANGTAASAEQTVDTNGDAHVVLPLVEERAGYAALTSVIDEGDVLGVRAVKAVEVSPDFRTRVAVDTPLFVQTFEGTIIPQAQIQLNLTTMTAPMSGGFLQLNAANATASGNAANFRTYRTFSLNAAAGLQCEVWARHANATATNAITEFGLGYAAAVAAPTDGAFFRILSGGQLRAVVNFGGTETAVDISTTNVVNRDNSGAYDPAEVQHYLIYLHNDHCHFWINDILVATIDTPSAQPNPTASTSLPLFGRVYNSGVASAGRRLEIGFLGVQAADVNMTKRWGHILSGMGAGGYQTQTGVASGQTALYSPTAIAAPTWTANTAPATNAFGGQWISPAPLPAGSSGLATIAETHYPIFAFLNPVGTATLPGKNLYITGIRIGETFVTTVLGASATVVQWGIAVGSTASTLATVDGAATVGPRRLLIGAQNFAATAAVGSSSPGIQMDLGDAPLVVPPGCHFHVIAALFLNAATGSLHGSVTPYGYYE
jgi:hypothetical protein